MTANTVKPAYLGAMRRKGGVIMAVKGEMVRIDSHMPGAAQMSNLTDP